MLWFWLIGCATPDPLVGCWSAGEGRGTDCFLADGSYTVSSPGAGDFKGSWTREGTALQTHIEGFSADQYTVEVNGDRLTLGHERRATKTLNRQ